MRRRPSRSSSCDRPAGAPWPVVPLLLLTTFYPLCSSCWPAPSLPASPPPALTAPGSLCVSTLPPSVCQIRVLSQTFCVVITATRSSVCALYCQFLLQPRIFPSRSPLSRPLISSETHRVTVAVAGNGLNSPHGGEKEAAGERQQSTMPPNVPVRKDKKDIPVRRVFFFSSVFNYEKKICGFWCILWRLLLASVGRAHNQPTL